MEKEGGTNHKITKSTIRISVGRVAVLDFDLNLIFLLKLKYLYEP